LLPGETKRKFEALKSFLASLGRAAVAFSGGADSLLLLHALACNRPGETVAVTAATPFLPRREVEAARRLTAQLGVEHLLVERASFVGEGILANTSERCYLCKREILGALGEAARERYGIDILLDGTNADDRAEDRPGTRAAEELGVISPLREAGLGKGEIRLILRALGSPSYDKPPESCLATRIPPGRPITAGDLAMVAAAEEAMRDLGFRLVRVRHHGDLARIEVGRGERARFLAGDVMDEAARRVRETGFTFVTLDLAGYGGNDG